MPIQQLVFTKNASKIIFEGNKQLERSFEENRIRNLKIELIQIENVKTPFTLSINKKVDNTKYIIELFRQSKATRFQNGIYFIENPSFKDEEIINLYTTKYMEIVNSNVDEDFNVTLFCSTDQPDPLRQLNIQYL
jgi:hypothetical protein